MNFLRPVSLSFVVLLQFCMWYRVARPGREEEAIQEGPVVPIVTPRDTPAPPGQAILPAVVTLENGKVLRKMRCPVAVSWDSESVFPMLAMLKVISI